MPGAEITNGRMVIDVEYFGFNVYEETYDLCEKTQCPISGDFVVSHSQSLPILTPPVSSSYLFNLISNWLPMIVILKKLFAFAILILKVMVVEYVNK